ALEYNLSKLFEKIIVKDVDFSGKSYYNIILSNYKLNETYKNMGLCIFIDKKDLRDIILDSVNWFYLVNPKDASSSVIKRTSKIDTFSQDIANILERKLLDPQYVSEHIVSDTKAKKTPLYIYEATKFNDFFITKKGYGKEVDSNILVINEKMINSLLEK